MHRIAAKFVPRLLTTDQKEQRIDICIELKERASSDETFLSRIITGDESWMYGYDPETKQQSSQWKSPESPRPKKCGQVKSNVKSMLIVFFDMKELVHTEYVPQGQTVNSTFYCNVLRRLRGDIRRKRPELWRDKSFLLHHDNAPSHNSFFTRDFWQIIPWPWFPIRLIRRIWHSATSVCSLIWKWNWRAAVLRLLNRFKTQRRKQSQKLCSKNFFSSGRRGGTSVLQRREIISRMTAISGLNFR